LALTTVKLGDFIENVIKTVNDNFSDLEVRKVDGANVPTKVSELSNDSGFQTAQQVAEAVAALAASAPETLDTLKELADALGNDPNFAATIAGQIAAKVDKVEGKGLSANDFTDALLAKLNSLSNYTLPVGGELLGGVKNGGNVTINADGTMTAPAAQQGVSVTRLDFGADDARWGPLTENSYTLTVASSGKSPIGVYRKDKTAYGLSMSDLVIDGANIAVTSYDKFEGYLLLI